MPREGSSSAIFFPWERRRGVRRWLGTGRIRPVLSVVFVLGFVIIVGARERQKSGVRQTRATLLAMRHGVDAYMADNEGKCPESLQQVLSHTSYTQVPSDAWGNSLRLTCPARREGERYELMSDGPDGKPGGLDRIE